MSTSRVVNRGGIMRRTMHTAVLGIAALAAALPAWAGDVVPNVSLDGTRWQVKVTPDESAKQAGGAPFSDTFIFKDGQVLMTACAKRGFQPSMYSVMKIGEDVSFTTQQ